MLDWSRIDTVLLDMDGTLLDLHFDTHFWTEHVPCRYAEKHGISLEAAKAELYPRMRAVEGTMSWYCLDYWSRELALDIPLLKLEVEHLIAVHPYVVEFLDAVRAASRRVILVTNAHMRSLELKMERTRLGGHFDAVVCSHHYGMPKEQPRFWERMRADTPFEPERALLVDDSLAVLRSARDYGIRHLRAVHRPDTRQPPREIREFDAIHTFRDIMPPAGGGGSAS